MRGILVAGAVLAGCLGVLEPRLAAQKQQQLFVSLTGADGTPVAGLQANDVHITEDGAEVKLLKIEPIDWPTKVQVLVDNGRNNTNPLNPLRDGLKAFFEAMPAGVEMSLYTTSPQPRPIVKPTTDKQKLIDGINLIAPDGGAGAFFDALSEAATRIDKDKAPQFPVLMMVGSDLGRNNFIDRDYMKLQENIIKHAITVHVIVSSGGAAVASSGGAVQTEVGLALTKMTGGRYENIGVATRLSTLLPEYGKRIAESSAKQSHQYRLTYERPANAKAAPQIGASISKPGTPVLTVDGHIP